MKGYKLIPILAIALLIPSFAEAKHSHRKRENHRIAQVHRHGPPPWAPAYGYRAKQARGRGYYHDDRCYRDYGYHENNRRERRRGSGVSIGGVVVIRF